MLLAENRKLEDVGDKDRWSARGCFGDQQKFGLLSHYTKHPVLLLEGGATTPPCDIIQEQSGDLRVDDIH